MKGVMIKQKRFARSLRDRLARRLASHKEAGERILDDRLAKRLADRKEASERILALTAEDLDFILSEMWKELARQLRDNKRVIFEGWASYFTRPVKRKCYNMTKNSNWWTFMRRIRMTPLKDFRDQAEVEISEEEYQEFLAEKESRKQKKN